MFRAVRGDDIVLAITLRVACCVYYGLQFYVLLGPEFRLNSRPSLPAGYMTLKALLKSNRRFS